MLTLQPKIAVITIIIMAFACHYLAKLKASSVATETTETNDVIQKQTITNFHDVIQYITITNFVTATNYVTKTNTVTRPIFLWTEKLIYKTITKTNWVNYNVNTKEIK